MYMCILRVRIGEFKRFMYIYIYIYISKSQFFFFCHYRIPKLYVCIYIPPLLLLSYLERLILKIIIQLSLYIRERKRMGDVS